MKNQGFTFIELMIVVTIAEFLLLLQFLHINTIQPVPKLGSECTDTGKSR